jgi:exopolysaccharide biosynthesis polyprenyl glycosylphosphotransferase
LSRVVEREDVQGSSFIHAPSAPQAHRRATRQSSRRGRHVLLRRVLACADVAAALLASFSLAAVDGGDPGQLAWSLVFLPVWIIVAKLLGLYDDDERALRHLTVDEAPRLVLWAVIGTGLLSFLLELSPAGRPEASRVLAAGLVAACSVLLLRALVRFIWRHVTAPERIALVGDSEQRAIVRRKFELFPDLHMEIVVEHDPLRAIGGEVPDWLRDVDRLVVAPGALDGGEMRSLVALSTRAGTMLTVVPPYRDVFTPAARLNHLAELPLLEYGKSDLSRSTLMLKRLIDVSISAVALVVLLPVFAIIAVAIKIDTRGPVLYTQLRAGARRRPFSIVKFRSMVSNAEEMLPNLVRLDRLDEPVFKLLDDPRVTRVGRVLRRWSLDELPQLWNVLVGDMSLVGPRPEEVALVERYTPEQQIRLVVKPGLTGPMQVNGRGALTLEERIAVERAYIENLSIGGDVRILGMTIASVLHGRGAY